MFIFSLNESCSNSNELVWFTGEGEKPILPINLFYNDY